MYVLSFTLVVLLSYCTNTNKRNNGLATLGSREETQTNTLKIQVRVHKSTKRYNKAARPHGRRQVVCSKKEADGLAYPNIRMLGHAGFADWRKYEISSMKFVYYGMFTVVLWMYYRTTMDLLCIKYGFTTDP